MSQFYTYAHTKSDGSIFYLGQGRGRRAYKNSGRSKAWKTIVLENGFIPIILADWETHEEALNHEKLLIASFRDMKYPIINQYDGGEIGNLGYKHTNQTREKLRTKSLENGAVERCKWLADDPKIKAKRIKATIGKKRTEESKNLMSIAKDHNKRRFIVNDIEFDSIMDFARKTNSQRGTIKRWLNEGRFDKLKERLNANLA